MYGFPEMINMGLKNDQEWPSEAYQVVAVNLLICNPNINTIDKLTEGVQKVLNIPEDKIKTITMNDLGRYGFDISVSVSV